MISLVIVGSIGLDDVETPFGQVLGALGGAACYAAYAAAFFVQPGMVSIAGRDFPTQYTALLKERGISLEGIAWAEKTFRWSGAYHFDMNEAETRKTELNAILEFKPNVPEAWRDASYVLLGNIDPVLQLEVRKQFRKPKLVMLDSMNFWIQGKKAELLEVIKHVDVLVLNDAEARQLFSTPNLVQAAKQALALGPRAVIWKKGEHGALLFTPNSHFSAAGYPLETIKDPTGCGDTFAGGLIGYLAKHHAGVEDEAMLRKAVVHGSAIASFNAEDFSLNRLTRLTPAEITQRVEEFAKMRAF